MNRIARTVQTSIGCKAVMAVTGLLLILFLIAHMLGNLQIYRGQDKYNEYAAMLKGLGPLLWAARGGLLAVFLVHILAGLRLSKQNRDARPEPYRFQALAQQDAAQQARVRAAIYMLLSGLLILLFVAYHLAHYTLGWIDIGETFQGRDAKGRRDVYRMFITGFQNPLVALSYVLAMLVLGAHLMHGMTSLFQTLGVDQPVVRGLIRVGGPLLAAILVLGNCAMPLSILLFDFPALPGGTNG